MENDTGFNELESLQTIQSMIKKAKAEFGENGHLFLVWGWLVLICSVAQFILMNIVQYEHHYLVWFLTWGAFIYQIFYLRRQHNKKKVKTYTEEILGFVWITFVILMFLFGVFGVVIGEEYFKLIYPGFLALYGMPTFLSGIILRFRALVIGGISCWMLSIVATFTPYDYQLLLLGTAVIIAWIIPGYLLRARFQKIKN